MNKLFESFSPTSSKEWKQKIQFDLKGADYNESLIWSSLEGIDVKPFYHPDDNIGACNANPTKSFCIGEQIFAAKEVPTLNHIEQAVAGGIEHIGLTLGEEIKKPDKLFDTIKSHPVQGILEFEKLPDKPFREVFKTKVPEGMKVGVDLIGNLASSGNWYYNLKQDHKILKSYFREASPDGFTVLIGSDLYQNAGANIVQQLAYAMAHANEYLNHYHNEWNIIPSFRVAVGYNYFFEIAKIRALRLLWQTLADEYKVSGVCSIIATPSRRNKSIFDYNNNMIRTSLECMSAILGGADIVSNLPYDVIYHKSNEFGDRIARNQLLILKHESYFDEVLNPAEGAYYIESLTRIMAEKALAIFKKIETEGGFVDQLFKGIIQRKIKESAGKEQSFFNNSDLVLVGSNRYPNPDDKMSQELELYPFVKTKKRKTIIPPIIPRRLAEDYEKQRLEKE